MRLESRVFSTPESAKISDTWTSVRILAADDLDADGAAFMARYDVRAFPTLLAVTAGGALLEDDLLGGQMRDADYLFAALLETDKANGAFLARRDEVLASEDPKGLRELATVHLERREAKAARGLLEQAVAAEPSPDAYEELLGALRALGDLDAEETALGAMIQAYPEHALRMSWRMRRATMRVPPPANADQRLQTIRDLEAGLEALRAEVAKETGATADEAEVRVELLRLAGARRDTAAARAHADWVIEQVPDEPSALDARLLLAELALADRDEETVKALAQAVLERAEDGPHAMRAHAILGDLAYGAMDMDGMEKHFKAVVELAPGTQAARDAQEVLDYIARKRNR